MWCRSLHLLFELDKEQINYTSAASRPTGRQATYTYAGLRHSILHHTPVRCIAAATDEKGPLQAYYLLPLSILPCGCQGLVSMGR